LQTDSYIDVDMISPNNMNVKTGYSRRTVKPHKSPGNIEEMRHRGNSTDVARELLFRST